MMRAVEHRRRFLWVAGSCLAGVLLFFYVRGAMEGVEWYHTTELAVVAPDNISGPLFGKKIGDFELTDRSGAPIRLSRFDGVDVLVLHLWSSGCPVCRQGIPSLMELDRRLAHRSGVELLTIVSASEFSEVASYFPRGTRMRILFDPDGTVISDLFGTEKFPETFVLDRDRRVRARFDGIREWHSDSVLRFLESFR